MKSDIRKETLKWLASLGHTDVREYASSFATMELGVMVEGSEQMVLIRDVSQASPWYVAEICVCFNIAFVGKRILALPFHFEVRERWRRENYVNAQLQKPDLNPVVLEKPISEETRKEIAAYYDSKTFNGD